MPKPKKLLFLMSDEHQAEMLSCAANSPAATPNLDRLAARGARFKNAWTPNPICVPARAAMATGKYAHETGYWDNALAYDGEVESWGHRLMEVGVRVESIGKLHYRNETDPTGFHRQTIPMHIKDGIGQVWGSVRNPLPDTPKTGKMLWPIGAGRSKYNQYDESVAEKTVEWLREHAEDQEPWCLFSSFVAPHFPLVVPEEFLEPYLRMDLPMPRLRSREGHQIHPWNARLQAFWRHDEAFEDDGERRLAIASYCGLVSFLDFQIGKVLDALEETGQLEDTLVIYTSDHGECLGMRDNWGKSVLYGEATRIPLMIAGPGVERESLVETPASLIDIAPTICGFFGAACDKAWHGASLLGIAAAPADRERVVFSEYHAVGSPSGAFMVANARWKYHYYCGYGDELFDLESDSLEAANLAGRSEFERIRSGMLGMLHEICDPEKVDALAKRDQDALVQKWGGPERAYETGTPGATPVPI